MRVHAFPIRVRGARERSRQDVGRATGSYQEIVRAEHISLVTWTRNVLPLTTKLAH